MLLTTVILAACSSAPTAPPAAPAGTSPVADTTALGGRIPVTHIHAAVRDPGDGALLLATHEGLYRRDANGWNLRGPVIDLMGFSIDADGTYYASGHPGSGSDLPQPLGLIRSTDAGHTWTVLSRGGQSDFHALTVGQDLFAGFDGILRISPDGTSWQDAAIPSPPHTLTASTAGQILATTASGLLVSSDAGRSWRRIDTPAPMLAAAFVDDKTIVAVTTGGIPAQSTDGGVTWRTGPESLGPAASVSGARTPGGIEIIVVVGTSVIGTTDLGASIIQLA